MVFTGTVSLRVVILSDDFLKIIRFSFDNVIIDLDIGVMHKTLLNSLTKKV